MTNLIAQAKSLAQTALSSGYTDAATLGTQYNEVMDQIDFLAVDSGYKGVNFLPKGLWQLNSMRKVLGNSPLQASTLTLMTRCPGQPTVQDLIS